MDMENLSRLFESIGLDSIKAKESAKNKRLSKNLFDVIHDAGVEGGCERTIGIILYSMAATCPAGIKEVDRKFIADKIVKGDLKTDDQLQAAFKYVTGLCDVAIDEVDFNDACGVGFVVTEEAIQAAVESAIKEHGDALREARYSYNMAGIMKNLRNREDMRWADKRLVKEILDSRISAILGPREGEEEGRRRKKESTPATPIQNGATTRLFSGEVAHLHRPGENPQISEEIRRKHLEATGGKVVTRFPPEPNGFLHIGHAKAINLNFRYAEAHGGTCYLRFDDTNPEAEEPHYYEAIRSNVEWLGFTPNHVTAASDYFPYLYECALVLVRKGKAYVCHMTQEEMALSRGGADGKGLHYDSPWRNRTVEENLTEFEKMKDGGYEEGKATLRLKQDMQSGNPFMWDLVAYRVIQSSPHCRTGRQWNIYPMYDFTHCLCDSIENITHSMCTTEFINAREAYYWVCDNVGVYKPVQWEYSRLNITNTVLSKRKLTKLVDAGVIRSWDDPRVYTLAALRRRGFTPRAINNFVEELGVTTAYSVVDLRKLESHVRDDLNKTTMRRMAILDPVLVHITNLADDFEELLEMPNDPRDPSKGDSFLPLTSRLYIDRNDFRTEDDKNFFRLTPNQSVGIYRAGVFSCTRFETDPETGKVALIEGTIDRSESAPKPKTFITWVPLSENYSSPLKAEVRFYSPLFKSRNPDSVPGGFLADVDPNSLTVIPEALVDPRLTHANVEDKFQFQRVGYFCVDPDTTEKKLVFNLTVSIKEDPNKN